MLSQTAGAVTVGDDSHRVCCGTRDLEVSTLPESVAVPVPQHSRRVSDSVGGVTTSSVLRRVRASVLRFLGPRLAFGVAASLCLGRLRDPACDYCSLVDVALYQILAVLITVT